ncbi:hypothetical protein H072_2359 [Dactylellina haptotyla CBS 200.50]|uniref:glucan endo-1,6-beta-glucosidase n=1 Tax=Dactylellina haptotyla (strain CBS 200.50) TaxID=1284197 RepID=S8ARH0_DACHA|nr:hypothetical protein H072_2359 [Dactylellina haptotyla CBS 200.50]
MLKSLVTTLLALSLTPLTEAWLPTKDNGVIRGVNLGGLFIIEPWMQSQQWNDMGCGPYKSEFDCVLNLGQEKADAAFKKHWETWITETDFQEMAAAGLNTVRIPIGYWILETLVYTDSEHFPKGALWYLENVLKMAKAYGIYVILDLHGAPGAQIEENAFTGQYAPTAGFYADYQYKRAIVFLGWITRKVYTKPEVYGNVGMLQVLNEPKAWKPEVTATLISEFYPRAWKKIRGVEDELGIRKDKRLHVMFMDEMWGSGNPNANLPDTEMASYDYHKYVKWDTSVEVSKDAYMRYSCTQTLACKKPLVVGEWSLSVPDNVEHTDEWKTDAPGAVSWYSNWFIAQQQMYERSGLGWVFWNWKSTLGDWRWSYRDAVNAGVIPKTLAQSAKWNVCAAYKNKRDEVGDAVEIPEFEAAKRDVVVNKAPAPSGKVETRSHRARHSRIRRAHGHGHSHFSHSK